MMTETQWTRIFTWTRFALLPLFISGNLAAQAATVAKPLVSSKSSQIKAGTCRAVSSNCFDETFTGPVVSRQKMDILFVVETSKAMAQELPTIKNGIANLIETLPSDLDYNVGVMLSHGSTSNWSGRLFQTQSQEPIVLRSKEISRSQIKSFLNQKLSSLVQDPDSAGGDEGMFSVFNGISSPSLLAASKAAEFFRADAGLGVVFVADQRDICAANGPGIPQETNPAKLSARIRDCEGLTATGLSNRLKSLKVPKPLRVSGVIYAKPPVPAGVENELGYGYLDMIRLNGSTAVDIVQDDITMGILPVVIGTTATLPEFNLTQSNIDPTSVSVTVNGQSVGFKLNGTKVTLNQLLPSGAHIVIHYCVQQNATISTKAEKLAAIMTMACPIPNRSYPKNYSAPSASAVWEHLRACTAELYPETPTTAQQQKTLDQLLNSQDPSLRQKLFKGLWYNPVQSDHFEYYFGLEIKEAVQIFCLNNGGLTDVLITSEYARAMYDQIDTWQNNPTEQKKWRFAQMLRQQLLSCLNR